MVNIWVEKMMSSVLCVVGESTAGMSQEKSRGMADAGGGIDFRAEGEKESNKRRWRSDQYSCELHSPSGGSCHLLPLACSTD